MNDTVSVPALAVVPDLPAAVTEAPDTYDMAVATWHTVTITEYDGSIVTTEVNGMECPWGCQFGWHNYCLRDCPDSPFNHHGTSLYPGQTYEEYCAEMAERLPCNGVHRDDHPHPCPCDCQVCTGCTASSRRDRLEREARQRQHETERQAYLDAHPEQREIDAAIEQAHTNGISAWLFLDAPYTECTHWESHPLTACDCRPALNPEFWQGRPGQLIYAAMVKDLALHLEDLERHEKRQTELAVMAERAAMNELESRNAQWGRGGLR